MKSKINRLIDYSIIIPVYQNEGSLKELFHILKTNVIDKNPQYSSEVIFVDDGSTDKSFQILHDLYEAFPKLIIKLACFSDIIASPLCMPFKPALSIRYPAAISEEGFLNILPAERYLRGCLSFLD